jgi:hypothetical protein
MQRWRKEDQKLVVDMLFQIADDLCVMVMVVALHIGNTDATTRVWIGHLLGRQAASQTRTAVIQSVLADRGEAWKEMDLSIDKETEGMFQCHLKLEAWGPAATRCDKKRCYRHAPVSSLLPIRKVPKWCAILANFSNNRSLHDSGRMHFIVPKLAHTILTQAISILPRLGVEIDRKHYTSVFTHLVCRSTLGRPSPVASNPMPGVKIIK